MGSGTVGERELAASEAAGGHKDDASTAHNAPR